MTDEETGEVSPRRIVACVNALAGVPTEWLESYTAGNVENVIQENARLQTELAELRKAQGEPVAVANKGIMSDGFTMAVFDAEEVPEGTKLYTSAPTIPEGYVLVPVEPTEAMVDAGNFEDWSEFVRDVYGAMLAAAPKPTKDAA